MSVIVPFFNAARFLVDTVESVLGQTYDAWELLLIDDGSSDDGTTIAVSYSERHPGRIVYLAHPGHANRGVAAARNLGIRHARGEFLALLDADDVWLPDKLQEQVPLLESHPDVGMLYGNSLFWHSWTGHPADVTRDYEPRLGVPLGAVSQPPEILIRFLQRRAAAPCPCSILARRVVVEHVGGFEESMRTVLEDQAFLAKMLIAAPAYVADRTWDKYRIHDDSSCAVADRTGRFQTDRLEYLEWLGRYLRDHGLTTGRIWRAFQRERLRCYLAHLFPGAARLRRRLVAVGGCVRDTLLNRPAGDSVA